MPKLKKSVRPRIVVQLIAGMALFGSATPLSKIIGEAFPIFSASFMRMAIAIGVLAPFVWFGSNRFAEAQRSDFAVMAAIAFAGMVGFTTAMLFGMRMTTGVIGSTIMSAVPAVTAAAAVIFFGDAMNWRKAGALALAITGVVSINVLHDGSDDGQNAVLFGAILVGVAVCFEVAYTLLSRRLSDGITSLEATLGASIMAAPLFIALAFLFDPQPFFYSDVDARTWGALIFWGAATGGLAPVLWYNGVRKAPGALTAGSMSVMPLTALLLSYWLLEEQFRWVHLFGFGLVFAGLLLMIIEHAKTE